MKIHQSDDKPSSKKNKKVSQMTKVEGGGTPVLTSKKKRIFLQIHKEKKKDLINEAVELRRQAEEALQQAKEASQRARELEEQAIKVEEDAMEVVPINDRN